MTKHEKRIATIIIRRCRQQAPGIYRRGDDVHIEAVHPTGAFTSPRDQRTHRAEAMRRRT